MLSSKTIPFIVGILFLATVGCTSKPEKSNQTNDGYTSSNSGFRLKIHQKGNGNTPKVGDLILLTRVQSYNDSVMLDGKESVTIQLTNPEFQGDLYDALAHLHEGDSASILTPVDSLLKSPLYRDTEAAKLFKAGTFIKNEVKIIKVYNEDQLLAEAVHQKHPEAVQDPQGFYIIYLKKGSGPAAKAGQTISMHQTGSMLDGTLFSATDAVKAKDGGVFNPSIEYGPLKLKVGDEHLPIGWNRVFPLLHRGDRVLVYYPSYLMFGPKGDPFYGVPGFTSVIYEFDVLDLK